MSTVQSGTNVPLSLDSNQTHMNSSPLTPLQRYSLEVEQWVYDQLVSQGYSPKVPPDFFQKACDLMVSGLCVEVKAARKTYRVRLLASGEKIFYERWQWFIGSSHKTEYALILVADSLKGGRFAFIVPGSQVGTRTHLQITSHPQEYHGWMADYLEKWSVIEYLANRVYCDDGPLFEQWEREGEKVAA